jgi:probable FeS assembly SUF system protein SufT
MSHEQVEFSRNCDAIAIPQGHTVTVPAGARGWITQALGDTYTVQLPSLGGLFRISGSDADAIGRARSSAVDKSPRGPVTEETVWSALRNVYDPEIPVNVVDLGLIYDLRLEPGADGRTHVHVKMTLTAQGCGMGPAIARDAQARIEQLEGVASAEVQIVWDPPWNPHMISPAGRARLGMD